VRAGPSCRKPQAASMGSSGSGSMVTNFSLAKVTKTLPPGLSPIFSRISAGMTTWPLAEVLTIGIYSSSHMTLHHIEVVSLKSNLSVASVVRAKSFETGSRY